MIRLRDPCGIARELRDIIEHCFVLIRNWRGAIVLLQGLYQFFIESDATQKLCVRFDSIVTPVCDRHDSGDHLLLTPAERQVRRHQDTEGRECVV